MRLCATSAATCCSLLLLAAILPQLHAASNHRIINQILAFGEVTSGTVAPLKYAAASAASSSSKSPAAPADPPAPVPAAAYCYNITVDPSILSSVVFWKGKSLYARMQTCSGMPLLRASVYVPPLHSMYVRFVTLCPVMAAPPWMQAPGLCGSTCRPQ